MKRCYDLWPMTSHLKLFLEEQLSVGIKLLYVCCKVFLCYWSTWLKHGAIWEWIDHIDLLQLNAVGLTAQVWGRDECRAPVNTARAAQINLRERGGGGGGISWVVVDAVMIEVITLLTKKCILYRHTMYAQIKVLEGAKNCHLTKDHRL